MAVVDVGPGGAAVAIVSLPHTGASEILALSSSPLAFEPRTPAQAKSVIAAQISEAAERANKLYAATSHRTPITGATVVLHAPWAHSETMAAKQHFDREVRLTDTHVENLAREALAHNKAVDTARLLEAAVIRISVNGYPTPDPSGMHARSLDVVSLASDVDPTIRSTIEGAVHRSFPVAEVTWRSATRALIGVAEATRLGSDFMFIDISAENTHIASFSQGALTQLVIPEGARSILARAAAGKPADEVLGYIRMIARDACSSEACEAVRQALASSEPDLVRIFGEAMAKIATERRAPNELLLSAYPDLEEWLVAFFSRIDFAQFTVTSLPMSVYTPTTLDIDSLVVGAHAYDPITIGAALVNIENRS